MSSSRKTVTTSRTVGTSCRTAIQPGLEAGHAGAEDRQQRHHPPPEDEAEGARAAGGRARRGAARGAGRARRRRSPSGRRRSGRPGPAAAGRRGGGRARRRSARRGGRRGSARGRSACSGPGTWRWPPAGPARSRSPARPSPAGCRRSRPRRAGRARARTAGGRRSAPRARRAPSRAACRRACSRPAARRRCRARAPRSSTAPGSAPCVPPRPRARDYRRIAGLSFVAAPEWRNWYTRGTQNAVSFGTCGFESHLRHMCGRFTLTDPDPRLLKFRFDLRETAQIEDEKPRFNVAPTDPVLAVRLDKRGGARAGAAALGTDPALRRPGEVGPAADQRAGRDGGRGAGLQATPSTTASAA